MHAPTLLTLAAGLTLSSVGCGSVTSSPDASGDDDDDDLVSDAAALPDAPIAPEIDAGLDAPCLPQPLFIGGTDNPAEQGWVVYADGSAYVTTSGPSVTQLQTQGTGGMSGSILLMSLPNVVVPGEPWGVEFVVQLFSGNPHNYLDGAAVLMGSYSPPTPDGDQRAEMIYLDGDGIGWADETGRFDCNNFDSQFHTYQLRVDAAGNAAVTRDGAPALSRAGFLTNGSIALGDQTNDSDVEATTLVRSVSLLCP